MGMFYDHTCDAITAVFENLLIQRVMQIGSSWAAIVTLGISTIPFYYKFVEAHYLGSFT